MTGTIIYSSQWLKKSLILIILDFLFTKGKHVMVQPPTWHISSVLQKVFSNSNDNTTICVKTHSFIKFLVLSTAAQSNTSVCFDSALLLCQHVCVKGPGCIHATGLRKSKPISVSESWGMALCIQTCFNQADTLWQWQGLVYKGQGLNTLRQLLTATRGTNWLCPCMCIHSATCDAMLGQWGGNSANVAVFWPSGWPGIGHADIPSLSNK